MGFLRRRYRPCSRSRSISLRTNPSLPMTTPSTKYRRRFRYTPWLLKPRASSAFTITVGDGRLPVLGRYVPAIVEHGLVVANRLATIRLAEQILKRHHPLVLTDIAIIDRRPLILLGALRDSRPHRVQLHIEVSPIRPGPFAIVQCPQYFQPTRQNASFQPHNCHDGSIRPDEGEVVGS